MTFREYIQSQPVAPDPLGDFVDDVKGDKEFPDVADRAEMVSYLHGKRACREAVQAGEAWWGRYIASNSGAELYRHFSASGELLYVGISLSSLRRLVQHRGRSHWFHDITKVEIERFATRDAALQAEKIAIRCERPSHNVAGAVEFNASERTSQ